MDLRFVVARSTYLKKIAELFKLRNNEAVCSTNKALTRFRLVLKINKSIFMCIPEIDEQSKLSIFLRISEELARLADSSTKLELKIISKGAKERIKKINARDSKLSVRRAA
jgi:hypothetical protein